MIKFTHRGDLTRTHKFLSKAKNINYRSILDRYGNEGVRMLQSATPVDTSETAKSWSYETIITRSGFSLYWKNSNLVDGIPVVILLQYGHGTRSGSFVEGRDFINPAMRPLFDSLVENLWKEVTSL